MAMKIAVIVLSGFFFQSLYAITPSTNLPTGQSFEQQSLPFDQIQAKVRSQIRKSAKHIFPGNPSAQKYSIQVESEQYLAEK